jgi:hypothetical protein
LTLWPVFLESVVQEDHVRLFEVGDVVTWPVMLVDAAADRGWPARVGVETTVTVTVDGSGRRKWARTASGLSVRTQLPGSMGASFSARAALASEIQTSALMSFVTGTVRKIELASVPAPDLGDAGMLLFSDEQWTLTETPVAPVTFRHPLRHEFETWDEGILVHLDVFTPRCRCRDIGWLRGDEAARYAQRHLQATDEDREAETAHYVCPDTGTIWLWHRWTRKRYAEHPNLKLSEPMLLTRQQPGPDLAASQPLPSFSEFDQIALDELTGSFKDVAQLSADGKSDLERAGIRLTPIEPETAGPVSAAAVQLHNGSQYLLIEHVAHPERFIDVRAQTSAPSSKLAARQLLAAVGVPDARVLWLGEHWLT